MLYRKDVDRSCSHGCGNPDCDVDHARDGLFLNQACHPRRGLSVVVQDDALTATCRICQRPVITIAVEAKVLREPCHASTGTELFYKEGTITLTCAKCKEFLGKLTVRDE